MPVVYRLDERDCFVDMNHKWDRFAESNGAPELAGGQLVGQPLWRFIAGVEVSQIYREVFHKVREQNTQVIFPFRCDSNEFRRDMLMKVLPKSRGQIEIQCITTSILHLSAISDFEASQLDEIPELLRICSWCKKAEISGSWMLLEKAIKSLDLLGSKNTPRVTYGICRECEAVVRNENETRTRSIATSVTSCSSRILRVLSMPGLRPTCSPLLPTDRIPT